MSTQNEQPELTQIVGKIEGTKHKVSNWNGNWFVVGPGFSTRILDEIQHRRNTIKQNMIIIVGSPGDGKSYFGLRLAQVLDPNFNPVEQIVFEREHLLKLIGPNSPLRRGQCILVDEAQFVLGARNWFLDIQKDLLEHIEAVRSQGFVIIIVALHLQLMDKIIRQFVLSMMMDIVDRGVAKVYRLKTYTFAEKMSSKRLGYLSLLLPDVEYCQSPNCLKCKYITCCMTNRAVYERLKKGFLAKKNIESIEKIAARERRKLVDYDGLLEKIIAHKDKLVFKKNGNVNTESVRIIMEKQYRELIPTSIANNIIKRGEIQHPTIFKHSKEVKEE